MLDGVFEMLDLTIFSEVAVDCLQPHNLSISLLQFFLLQTQNVLKFLVLLPLFSGRARLLFEGNDFFPCLHKCVIIFVLFLFQFLLEVTVFTDEFKPLLVGFFQPTLPSLDFLSAPVLSQIHRPQLMPELFALLFTFLKAGGEFIELCVHLCEENGAVPQQLLEMRVLKGEQADLVLKLYKAVTLGEGIQLLGYEMDWLVVDLGLQFADALVQT